MAVTPNLGKGCDHDCGLDAEGVVPEIENMLRKVCCGATPTLVFVSFDDDDDGADREDRASSDDRLEMRHR